MIEIISISGEVKHVLIDKFSALDGWDIQRKFLDFAASTNKEARIEYIMEVLSYARVASGDVELPLKTSALIDNHLETWQNIELVFEAVLNENGIDPKTHAERPNYWAVAGAEMAIAFIAEATKIMGPAFQVVAKVSQE